VNKKQTTDIVARIKYLSMNN